MTWKGFLDTVRARPGAAATAVLVLALALGLPLAVSSFWLRIATGTFMWIGLALSWNMLGGYMGYISFGHGAFFGVGAYLTAMLMNAGVPFAGAVPLAGLVTVAFAAAVGFPTLRLHGSYFAIATWAFAEMMKQVALIVPWTGGAYGMRLPALLNENLFYYLMLGIAAAAAATTYLLFDRSRFGLTVVAIREEETAAQVLGIPTTLVKVTVFALSAFFAGLFGGAYAYWITYIHPDSVLGALVADQMVVMTLLGGLGTVAGPVLGAAVLYLGNRVLWMHWGETPLYLVLLGAAIALVILYLPDGLVSLPRLFGLRRPAMRFKPAPDLSPSPPPAGLGGGPGDSRG